MINSESTLMLMKSNSSPHKQHMKLWRSGVWSCNIWLYENITSVDGEELASSVWNYGRPLGSVGLWWFILFCFPVVCVISHKIIITVMVYIFKIQWLLPTWPTTVLMFVGTKLSFRIIISKIHLFSSGFFFPLYKM